MIIEYSEVPGQLVEEALTAVPAELNRESVRVWLSVALTAWESDYRREFFAKLQD